MARSDAVQVILEIVARMRQLDPRLRVTYESGWETRGNGLAARYVGGIVHDTTTPSSPAKPFPTQTMLRVGRPDLSGPIANFGGPFCTVDAPWIHVVAAFPANHAGASGGRSMGPLPRTSLFNPAVLGLEIDFSGLQVMPAGQMYVGHLWARAVADVLAGGNSEYVRAHFETSVTGKIDISYAANGSYDMAAFRRDAATLTPQGDDMSYSQWPKEDRDKLLLEIREQVATEFANNLSAMTAGAAYTSWPKEARDFFLNDVKDSALAPVLAGQAAGFAAALKAVSAGQPIDLTAVEAAAKRGAEAAFAEGVDVDVTVGGKPAGT